MDNKQPGIHPVVSVLTYLASYAVSFSRVYFCYDLLKKEPWLLALRTNLPQLDPDQHFSCGSRSRRQMSPYESGTLTNRAL
jgi:hypothetical protein